jgi:hypothetical protein
LLILAPVQGPAPVGASPGESGLRWEYRGLTKDQILSLGNTDLVAGLNRLGDEGWELAGVDGIYIFKRPRGLAHRRAEDIKDDIKVIEADVEQQRDRVAWAERMGKKGFLAENRIQFERDYLKRLELALARARRDLQSLPKDSKEPAAKPPKSEK